MLKICSKCGIKKSLEDFNRDNKRTDGLQCWCKSCLKQYRDQNAEKIKQYRDQEENRSHKREWDRQHHIKNKNYYYENYKHWYALNGRTKERIAIRKEYDRRYYEEHKEELKVVKAEYIKWRRSVDVCFVLRDNINSAINYYLKKQGGNKQYNSCLRFLPFTIHQLKEHLEKQFEPWMNWENHGRIDLNRDTWQIDHIIPQSALPYDSMEHPNFLRCWALSNLRPLRSIDNIRKGNKLMSANNNSGNSFLFPIDPEDEPTAEIVVQLDLFSDDDKQELEDGFELVPEPLNNEGRKRCFWCCEKTSKKLLLNSYIDFCEGCQK